MFRHLYPAFQHQSVAVFVVTQLTSIKIVYIYIYIYIYIYSVINKTCILFTGIYRQAMPACSCMFLVPERGNKLREAIVSFVISASPSILLSAWTNRAPTAVIYYVMLTNKMFFFKLMFVHNRQPARMLT